VIVTPPAAPAPEPIRFEVLLSLSWKLFRRNWIVALPPVIAMLIGVACTVALIAALTAAGIAHGTFRPNAPPPDSGFVWMLLFGVLVFTAVLIIVSLWAYVAMFGMADAAWARGTATFDDGFRAFRTRTGAFVVAGIGMVGLAFVALILVLPTLGLSFVALALATMYVGPAVVSGGCDGFAAIGESFRLVRRFFGTSAIALLVLVAINYGISMVATFPMYPLEFAFLPHAGETVPHMPPIGLLAAAGLWFVLAMVVAQAYVGYFVIAIVGLYRSLRAQPDPGAGPVPGRSFTV
jgi:hypothetical protein